MALLDKRLTFAPVEYPRADDYWVYQAQNQWSHLEITLDTDEDDWNDNHLSETEKQVIARTLNGFTQIEVIIADYWSNKVANWFKKPEIQGMANAFAGMEVVHQKSYAALQQTLGIDDFDAFLYEPTAKAKIDRVVGVKGKSHFDIALSLAVFSAFNEGVSLFSSFAILMSFQRAPFNKLKGIGQIIQYSCRDEVNHSHAGCWLFRTFLSEYPKTDTKELREAVEDAARLTVQLEDEFIDQSFSFGPIESISAYDLKNFIRHQTNGKLRELGYEPLWLDIDQDSIERMHWFNVIASGRELQDFFAQRVTEYAVGAFDFGNLLGKKWISKY